MLHRLRVKFTLITMSLLALVLLSVIGLLYFSSASAFDRLVSRTLQHALVVQDLSAERPLAHAGGSGDKMPQVPVIIVRGHISNDQVVIDDSINTDEIDDDKLEGYVRYVIESGKSEGMGWGRRIRWMSRVRDDQFTIAAAGMKDINDALRQQLVSSVIVFVVTMAVLTLSAWKLSGWAFAPVDKAMAQQRQFVADASHELKTPLSVIIANLQILERSSLGTDPEAQGWIERTDEEAHHMLDLITDMLELAKSEADESPVDRTATLDLTSIVEKTALQLDALAYERDVSIETHVQDGISLRGNEGEVERMVMTLVDNACKYASPGTTVRVSLEQRADVTELVVNNCGPVIDEADLPHVFERFFRSDRSRTQSGTSGYGLGLAIAKAIVENHGGRIRVTSSDEDGTAFTVTFPLGQPGL